MERLRYFVEPEHLPRTPKDVVVSNVVDVSKSQKVLILGFDTEFQGVIDEDVKDNELLSYQYSAEILHNDQTIEGEKWEGIIIPNSTDISDRLSIPEFLSIIISEGVESYPDIQIPKTVYLVAHFTRADVPAFSEFKDDLSRRTLSLENIRNSFVNLSRHIQVKLIDDTNQSPIVLEVSIRDSLHLTPSGSGSLKKVGEIVGIEKISLSTDTDKEQDLKENMSVLLKRDWELFRKYAITDAVISHHYISRMIRLYQKESGIFKLPTTLTSIGVDILEKFWKDKGIDPITMVGKEEVEDRYYSKKKGRYVTKKNKPFVKKVHWNLDFFTDGFHGGRNEEFWFGVLPEHDWFDYDLTSAYPSVMSMLGYPYWNDMRVIKNTEELLSYHPAEYVVANVNFKFPKSVRYPALPVRQEGGLIYPYEGNSTTHISEIIVAKNLGAEIEMVEGRYVPSKRHQLDEGKGEIRPFFGFVDFCIKERKKFEKKTLENMFWKELVNSTYGKTAQGLRERRVYDLRDMDTRRLPPSKITNPIFASFITGFCRATLTEIMNNLDDDVIICSVTTDGFLTTATEQQMNEATNGVCCGYYKDARKRLSGLDSWHDEDVPIYEIKHQIRQPIGWRTRGQATLKPREDLGDEGYVLAKAGIKPPYTMDKHQQNKFIVNLFLNRTPKSTLKTTRLHGIRDLWEFGNDLTDYEVEKIVSMEFDWKRRPVDVYEEDVEFEGTEKTSHLTFNTTSWDTIDQYHEVRTLWNEYNAKERHTLKTVDDFKKFQMFMENKLSLGSDAGKYLRKDGGDLIKLRQQIVIAERLKVAGTNMMKPQAFGWKKIFPTYKLSASQFAELLGFVGIDCKQSDVENGRRKASKVGWIPHQVPRNDDTDLILRTLKRELFPGLKVDQFLTSNKPPYSLTANGND